MQPCELTDNLTDSQAERVGLRLAVLLSLKPNVPEHPDRYQTNWGTKTPAGLARCLARILTEEKAAPEPAPEPAPSLAEPPAGTSSGWLKGYGVKEACELIKANLEKRSGKKWSVTHGRGTAYGWIHVTAPPKRRTGDFDYMTDEDAGDLMRLLGGKDPVYHQGVSIPASTGHYQEYCERSAGIEPTVRGVQYWD